MVCGDTSMIDSPFRSGTATAASSPLWPQQAASGTDTSKVEPVPGLLSSVMRPPIRLTIRSLMLSPSPVPP